MAPTAIHCDEMRSIKYNHVKVTAALAFAKKAGIIIGRNRMGDMDIMI